MQHFATIEEFNNHITSPDYLYGDKQGVCHAIQVEKPSPNDFHISLHFPDKRVSALFSKGALDINSEYHYEQAIPNQENPVWEPYIAAPELDDDGYPISYYQYQ